MLFTRHRRHSHSTPQDPDGILPANHPLVRATHWRGVLSRQLAVSAVLAAGSGALVAGGDEHAVPFAFAAAVTTTALAVGRLACRQVVRMRARDLIADGYETERLRETAVEARRLTSPRHRATLACGLERSLRLARQPSSGPRATQPHEAVRGLSRHQAQVQRIVTELRRPSAPPRGVALVERLLSDGAASPLYNPADECALAYELRRIRRLLVQ
jgi:hypothetical protein